MSKLSDSQREVLALIDAILAMLSKLPEENFTVNLSINPFDFLIKLLTKGEKTYDEIVAWLAEFLVKALPAIELGVKGLLLANLKEMVDCNIDPRIPYWMRQPSYNEHELANNADNAFTASMNVGRMVHDVIDNKLTYSVEYPDLTREEPGILVSINSIDYRNILDVSPLSEDGHKYYSGAKNYWLIKEMSDESGAYSESVQQTYSIYDVVKAQNKGNCVIEPHYEIGNAYQLFRSDDFNAFLWAVIHKTPHIVMQDLSGNATVESLLNSSYGIRSSWAIGDTAVNVIQGGSAVLYQLYMCLDRETAEQSASTSAQSVNSNSANASNEPFAQTQINETTVIETDSTIVPLSYNQKSANWFIDRKRFANFLLSEKKKVPKNYDNEIPICNVEFVKNVSTPYGALGNDLRLTILQKPNTRSDVGLGLIPLTFDKEGNPKARGNYTALPSDVTKVSNSKYKLNGGVSKLIPCYPAYTVYEFNFDFVMSMNLFDPVVVAQQLFDIATGVRLGGGGLNFGISVSKTETEYQMRIAEVVKNIVGSVDYEVSNDCFYTFDNAKYDAMSEAAELQRANKYKNGSNGDASDKSLDSVYNILNEFDNNASLQEQKEIMSRAINEYTANITEEVLPEDKYSWKLDLVTQMIQMLTQVCVEAIMSPKLLLLFEVNRKMMGDSNTMPSFEDILKAFSKLITSIVKELRDMILQELLNWVLELLTDLLNKIKDLIIKEQLDYYMKVLRGILRVCSFKFGKRAALENKLDEVNYADIDEIEEKPIEQTC